MKEKVCCAFTCLVAASALVSCDSPTGYGAGYGAAAGALIGAAATGNVRGASIGAAAGAATGALVGHAVQEDQARRYNTPPGGRYPLARHTSRSNIYLSPYTGRTYDLSDVPPGGLTRDVDTGGFFRRP